MKTTSPTYLAQELMAQWGWRALDDGRLEFAVRAHELAKLILLYGVFPEIGRRP
jgi:hypothetical protein